MEVLASEADSEELSFPRAFSEYDLSKQEEEESPAFSGSDLQMIFHCNKIEQTVLKL